MFLKDADIISHFNFYFTIYEYICCWGVTHLRVNFGSKLLSWCVSWRKTVIPPIFQWDIYKEFMTALTDLSINLLINLGQSLIPVGKRKKLIKKVPALCFYRETSKMTSSAIWYFFHCQLTSFDPLEYAWILH